MIKTTMTKAILFATATVLFISSCRKKDDVSEPDVFANFENSAQGISAAENSVTIKVKLSSAAATDIPVVLNVTETGVVAGTDYTTLPAIAAGKIHLTIPSGNTESSFTLTKVAGRLFDNDDKIVFDIFSSGTPVIIGATKQLTLSFAEMVAINTGTIVVNGGGATYPNKVFIDISANRTTGVNRTTWDLGFYGGDEFRVFLNSSVGMMAKQINKNDLATVTATDTIGFSTDVYFNQTAPSTASLAYIDYPDGSLSKTAIAEISATASDNKVYIVNTGKTIGATPVDRGWKKIRVIRNTSGGYTLQHADIAATTFTSVDIAKDPNYYFKYASFQTGAINIEPEKKKWDLAWTYFSNITNFGGGEVPYLFQDVILINRGVSIAKVMTTAKSYEAFSAADITTITPALAFLTTQNAIAADWRAGGGPGTAPSVRTDRYYIIKDGDNNYYKLKFTALTNGSGERGYPAYEAVWLKKD